MLSKTTLEYCEKNKLTILNRRDFPKLLAEISDPPEALFVQGDLNVLYQPALALVGTRRPSSYGVRSAMNFSKTLSEAGLCIVSGLARGIDSAAHRGALLGHQKTIAFLAHGHDEIYPRENFKLSQEILEKGGALVSEYAPFTGCRKHHFIARNRLVAGVSKGVLVIEAHIKSGSLITADFANDFGRDVFVLPGPYDDTNYLGSHDLIQNGAKLVKATKDILEEYPDFLSRKPPAVFLKEMEKFKKELGLEFSFEELFELAYQQSFSPLEQLKKWMENKQVAEISPQHYTWLS